MRQILFSILLAAGCMTASAQQKFMLPNSNPQAKDTEHEIEQYGGISILGVVNPSVEVYLPEASKANGCAVILCPGGGLRALSWTLNYDTAEWFSKRFGEDGTVYEAQIPKEHIYALFNGRNESEIILNPNYLTEIQEAGEGVSDSLTIGGLS